MPLCSLLKKLRLVVFTFSTVLLSIGCGAQKLGQRILSEGQLPSEFSLSLTEKFKARYDSIAESDSKFERGIYEELILQSSYSEDYTNRSGKLILNTSINEYVNDLAGHLLSLVPELESTISIYIVDSPDHNAWINANGRIYVTLGLLANIHSEAELAFILCHEIGHFLKSHLRNEYVESRRSLSGKGDYKKLNYAKRLQKLSRYSKNQELEADSLGLTLYSHLGYNMRAILNVFDFFIDPLVVDDPNSLFAFLHKTTGFTIPTETDAYLRLIKQDTLYSSHPSSEERRAVIERLLSVVGDEDQGAEFVVSEARFWKSKNIARQELSRLYLENHQYETAISNSYYVATKYDPGNAYEWFIGHALTQLAFSKSNRDYTYIIGSDTYFESSPALHQFIKQLSRKDAGLFAVNYNLFMCKNNPFSETWKFLLDKSIENLVFHLNLQFEDLSGNERYADSLFIKSFTKHLAEKNKLEKEKHELITNAEKRKAIAKQNEIIRKEGYALGIDSIVVLNPQSISVTTNPRNPFHIQKSEEIRQSLIRRLKTVSENIELTATLLDISVMDRAEIEIYNDYAVLSSWFNEKTSHPSEHYYVFSHIFISQMIRKYHTPYFGWVALYNVSEDKLMGREDSALDFYLFNLETSEMILAQREWIDGYITDKKIESSIQHILTQIKTKRK